MTTRVPYQVAPLAKHTATVIFLHGLGDTGLGWRPVAKMLNQKLPHVKWLLPNAPTRSITANGGFMMPGWFDLHSLRFDEKNVDRESMLETARTVDGHIQDEVNAGIPSERIVVGGFSQGGAMSLLSGLAGRGPEGLFGGQKGWKLGGVIGLSCWLPLHEEFPKMVSPHSGSMPVLMCHGTEDLIVPHDVGKRSAKALAQQGLQVLEESKAGAVGLTFKSYPSIGHSASPQEIQDIEQFLTRVLPRD